jgi:cyanate permease
VADPEQAAVLSGMAQSFGYLLASPKSSPVTLTG